MVFASCDMANSHVRISLECLLVLPARWAMKSLVSGWLLPFETAIVAKIVVDRQW